VERVFFGSTFVRGGNGVFGSTFVRGGNGVLAQPFLKVDYHEPNAPPPKTELAAIGSENASAIPGVAAPTNGVVSC
jgi:hypothetical protein